VTEAFIGPYPPGQETRHLDGDPLNNSVGNLCYGTRAENMQDRVRHKRAIVPETQKSTSQSVKGWEVLIVGWTQAEAFAAVWTAE